MDKGKIGQNVNVLVMKLTKLNKEIKETGMDMVKLKIHLSEWNISYDELFSIMDLKSINDMESDKL